MGDAALPAPPSFQELAVLRLSPRRGMRFLIRASAADICFGVCIGPSASLPGVGVTPSLALEDTPPPLALVRVGPRGDK